MSQSTRPKLFRYRHFEPQIILLCLRWHLQYALSYRDLEEMMAERGLSVDHTTIYRWVQHFSPILRNAYEGKEVPGKAQANQRSWRVDETYVKVKGQWLYLYRAVDSDGYTVEFMLQRLRIAPRGMPRRPNVSSPRLYEPGTQLPRVLSM